MGNKSAILHILYALFPLKYGRFIDVFGGSGSVLFGKPEISAFEVYNDFDRNLANLFHCMKERTMAVIRELGFCHLNSREDFIAIRQFFADERFDDKYIEEELCLTKIMLPPPEAAELNEIRTLITEDYDVRRAAMFLKLLRYSYSSSGKSYASQPFDIRKLFTLIDQLKSRMANVVVENQDFETLIKHYDRPDAFFYLDPPYFSTEDMYEVEFGWDDHVRLRDTLKNINGKFLLSYNDTEAVTIDTTAPETAPPQAETSLVTEYVPPETAAPIISQQPVQNAATPQAEAPSATSPPKAASGSETSPAEPKQPVSRPVEKTKAPEFNIDYWISFAKNYAVSIGLDLSPDAVECWDNPIIASAHSKYLERDITDCLNRYKNIEGFTGVWIWSEPDGKGSHILYIGYE